MAEASIRSFIAAPIPAAVKEALGQIAASLAGAGAVRWCTREQYHLTLKFLGDASPRQLDRVAAELDTIAKNRSHFMVELEGIGAFPRLDRPRVIWVGIAAGSEELKGLAQQIEKACAPIGFRGDGRPYRPHLTLGRVRAPHDLAALASRLNAARPVSFEPFPVEELLLMESRLQPGGAVHTVRARSALRG